MRRGRQETDDIAIRVPPYGSRRAERGLLQRVERRVHQRRHLARAHAGALAESAQPLVWRKLSRGHGLRLGAQPRAALL